MLTLVEKPFEPEAAKDTVPDLTSDDQAILERFLASRVVGQPIHRRLMACLILTI